MGTVLRIPSRCNVSASYHLLRLDGYLDIGRYPEIRKAFEDAPPSVPVLVDLQDAVGVDSVFLSELLLFMRRHRPQPAAVLILPKGNLAKIFDIANIGEKMKVFSDLPSAVAALGLGAARNDAPAANAAAPEQPPPERAREPAPE
jgi:anti-anti-sigma regulatory factor